MSASVWVGEARPEAPERLLARVREVLAANPAWERLTVADALVEAADALLREVLREGDGPARDRALDLLAADACVTWAFEAAADEPTKLVRRAQTAMGRFANVVAA